MSYVCKEYNTIKVLTENGVIQLHTCVSWVEQLTINDMFGISVADAFKIGFGFALVIIVFAIFGKLSRIGESNYD